NYAGCRSTQLIDGHGNFNVAGFNPFLKGVKLAECGNSYAIVSIMGPQSSGKSTLLNHLFGTNFREMDAVTGRSQTTKGIWIANCAGINPCTLVMDLEGSDGREREDDTTFEKQSALFALAVSDIVLINIWCNEIGREQAANKPLLKTAMMRLFTPRRTTLIFLIRDKSRIWESVPKPPAHKNTPLSDFFNIKVVALAHYEYAEEQFKEQVASLRQQFVNSIAPGGLAGDRRSVVMVATFRCEEIANERCSSFTHNPDWRHLEEASQSGPVPDFGRKLSSILGKSFSEYDAEAVYFDEGVRKSKRKHLEDKLLQLVEPAFQSMMGHLCSRAVKKFKKEFQEALNAGERLSDAADRCRQSTVDAFDKGCADSVVKQANWDVRKVRSKLVRDLTEHISSIRASKLDELTPNYKKTLNEALSRPIEALLEQPTDKTWLSISGLLKYETQAALDGFATDLSDFDLDEKTTNSMLTNIVEYARGVAEEKAKEAALKVLFLMKDRFISLLQSDQASRGWTEKDDILQIAGSARDMALKVLSVLSAIRLDDEFDHIDKCLIYALLENKLIRKHYCLLPDPEFFVLNSQPLCKDTLCFSVQVPSSQEETNRHNADANKPKKSNWRWVPPVATVAISAVSMVLGLPTL
ncbi:hypothetical protein KSS87_011325, partial [Heliosperma pusillum]